ncbi:hypothetical protein [Mobilicoccus massiliensis]|uniref:hypothetical protein n=1 Tax=Mobilicoccus massiliensis TaxID=1522310 RepID=UPI0011414122|nr:hypothetical protein [Mobilicoccus massiliensis]
MTLEEAAGEVVLIGHGCAIPTSTPAHAVTETVDVCATTDDVALTPIATRSNGRFGMAGTHREAL